ncbi:hypothetical protein [Streptomyces sp. NBC_01378]|uniref:hypothetical protein n=1 Tax=Streptomyces sp. NBC_01378 TaxID=2903844 RepID=UPI003865EB75
MSDLGVTFSVTFPDGPSGDRARAILPRAVKTSRDRLCTVSRTVEAGAPWWGTVRSGSIHRAGSRATRTRSRHSAASWAQ